MKISHLKFKMVENKSIKNEMAIIMSNFKSKEDIHDLFPTTVSLTFFIHLVHCHIVNEMIPPLSNCPMRDIKRILSGQMKTIKKSECPNAHIVKYPELSVAKAYEVFKDD